MKKVFYALAAVLVVIFVFCWVALGAEVIEVAADVAQGAGAIAEIAEDANAGTLPGEPFDWSTIATIAGATAATQEEV